MRFWSVKIVPLRTWNKAIFSWSIWFSVVNSTVFVWSISLQNNILIQKTSQLYENVPLFMGYHLHRKTVPTYAIEGMKEKEGN